MPDFCPPAYQCGTWIPVWMNGTHPTVEGQVVNRTACAYYGTDITKPCCDHTYAIQVKKCRNFFVYYLLPTDTCPVAYCFTGAGIPCPAGQGSPTGFSPCDDVYPISITNPTFTGPNVDNHSFNFTCTVTYPNNDPDLRFEVQWTFDGQTKANIPNVTLNAPQTETVLQGSLLKGNLDHLLSCRVRAWYANRTVEQKSPWRISSQSYYVGLRVEPARVNLTADTKNATVRVTSTVPIKCAHNFECCIFIIVDLNATIRLANSCTYRLCGWDPQTNTASLDIRVAPSRDPISSTQQKGPVLLAFLPIKGLMGGDYFAIFDNYNLTKVSVMAQQLPPVKCSWMGDPHITGFSGNYFHLYEPGDFTMYRNGQDNFEIQSRTFVCAGGVACQCGLMIKEETDFIHINNCGNKNYAPIIETSKPLRVGTVIERSRDGWTIMVYLPSGREVKLEAFVYYTNTYFTVPALDNGRGICGTPDGNPNNEYTYRDGSVVTNPCQNQWQCLPHSFFDSWRTNWEDNPSLFNTVPNPNPGPAPVYCQCNAQTADISCPVPLPQMNGRCTYCVPAENLPPFTGATPNSGRRKRDTGYDDKDEPEPPQSPSQPTGSGNYKNVTWPTASGITEEQARNRCQSAIQSAQLYSPSDTSSDVMRDIISGCLLDIQFTNSYDMVEGSVAFFTDDRQFQALQDINNYDTDDQGNLVLKANVTEVCPTTCLRQGSCVNGTCVCNTGYTGSSCQLKAGEAPRLLRIRGSAVCDVNQQPCRKIFMDAEGFEDGDLFVCRVQEILDGSSKSGVLLKAQFITDARLACPLPDAEVKIDRSVKTFSVSFTYDGSAYSNAETVTVFDSTCQHCDIDGCQRKPKTCLIRNLCYLEGDVNPSDAKKICNPSLSTSQWSDVPKPVTPSSSSSSLPSFLLLIVSAIFSRFVNGM